MRLKQISWQNIKSFGNNLQTIDFSLEGALWAITGSNGVGKCLSSDTNITIIISDKVIEKQFLEFLKAKNKSHRSHP